MNEDPMLNVHACDLADTCQYHIVSLGITRE